MRTGSWDDGAFPLGGHEAEIDGRYLPHSHYVDPHDATPVRRKTMDLEIRGTCIRGVPAGSVMVIEELRDGGYAVRDEDCVCEIDEPGRYHVTVYHPHYATGKTVLDID